MFGFRIHSVVTVVSDEIIPLRGEIFLIVSLELVQDESDDSQDKEKGCKHTHGDSEPSDGSLAFSDEIELFKEWRILSLQSFCEIIPWDHHSVVGLQVWERSDLVRSARFSSTEYDEHR